MVKKKKIKEKLVLSLYIKNHSFSSFHQLAYKMGICTGPGLTCMNRILRFIGKLNRVSMPKKKKKKKKNAE